MYRLHAGNHVVSLEDNVCRLHDEHRSLELTALTGQLAVLVNRLLTGFTRRQLFELLCDEAHPPWSRAHMWEQLGAWLRYEQDAAEYLPSSAIPENGLTGQLAHLRSESGSRLTARANQVIHVNTTVEPLQTLILGLARDGWRAFISHDAAKISQADTSLCFSSAHIGAGRTEVLAQNVRKISPWANVVSATALDGAELGDNHQALWLATSSQQLLELGPHLAVDLPTLPILVTDSCVSIGPWLQNDHECLNCVTSALGTVVGEAVSSPSLSSSSLALVTLATHLMLEERAQHWLLSHTNSGSHGGQTPPQSQLRMLARDGEDMLSTTVLLAPTTATRLSVVQLPDVLGTCTH